MSHTPGPWTVTEYNDDDLQRPTRFQGPCVIYADDDCEIHPIADCSCNHSCREADEVTANARLIAAAPELLEALKLYMSQFGQALFAHNIPFGLSQTEADAIARAAIAKAEGQ